MIPARLGSTRVINKNLRLLDQKPLVQHILDAAKGSKLLDDMKLYRVASNSITIKYEYEGNEEAYNPSWAQSS